MQTVWQWIQNHFFAMYLLYCLFFLVVSVILYSLFTRVFKFFCKKFQSEYYSNVLKLVRLPIFINCILLSIGIPFLVFDLKGKGIEFAKNTVIVLLIFSVAWLLVRTIKAIKVYLFSHLEQNERDKKFKTQFEILEKIVIVFIFFLAIVLSFMNFESIRRIGVSLFASAGVAGIIIGFAAQRLIAAVISGIQLALTQPIRINDTVVVENELGTVEEINLTYIVVKLWDLRRLVLPSTYFLDKPFFNWSRVTPELLCTVFVYVDYTAPVEPIRQEFKRLLEQHEDWDKKDAFLQVSNSNEKAMELRALFGVEDVSKAWGLRVFIREGLIHYITKNYPNCLPMNRNSSLD